MTAPMPAKAKGSEVPSFRLRREHSPTPVSLLSRIRAAKDLDVLDKLVDETFRMQPAAKTRRAWDEAVKIRRLEIIRSDPAL